MQRRQIGSLSVPVVGVGCNPFGRKIDSREAAAVVDAALDAGANFFDTADRYGYGSMAFSAPGRSEEFLGQALRGRRHQALIATKFGNPRDAPAGVAGSRAWVMRAAEASLRRLQTDYIDLYQMHRPDPGSAIEETLGALNELVAQGKVREIGCSNFTRPELVDADTAGMGLPRRFVSVQNEYSLLCREPENGVLPVCRERDIALVPYFPLAGGLLTGKYGQGMAPPAESRLAMYPPGRPHLGLSAPNLDRVGRLTSVAAAHGHTLLELALSWLLAHNQVASVIAGATRPDQVTANTAAAECQLSAGEIADIDRLTGQSAC
jgi:aryl-alcohol dehydrogenase-like predicted oxidoreductase